MKGSERATLAAVVHLLQSGGVEPVLVGGVALTLKGSDRVTRDTDLVARKPSVLEDAKVLVAAFYSAGFSYVTKLDPDNTPIRWIDNANVAAARILMDEPDSIFFWHPELKMKIDVLLDFPLPSSELIAESTFVRLNNRVSVRVASAKHLRKMKKLAIKGRNQAKDVQDLEFIETRLLGIKPKK